MNTEISWLFAFLTAKEDSTVSALIAQGLIEVTDAGINSAVLQCTVEKSSVKNLGMFILSGLQLTVHCASYFAGIRAGYLQCPAFFSRLCPLPESAGQSVLRAV
jgi:hypothetical protein